RVFFPAEILRSKKLRQAHDLRAAACGFPDSLLRLSQVFARIEGALHLDQAYPKLRIVHDASIVGRIPEARTTKLVHREEKMNSGSERIDRRAFLTASFAFAAAAACGEPRRVVVAGRKGAPIRLIEFDASGARKGTVMSEKVIKTDEEWKQQL